MNPGSLTPDPRFLSEPTVLVLIEFPVWEAEWGKNTINPYGKCYLKRVNRVHDVI